MTDYEQFIGRVFPPFTVEVERGRLLLFAKAIGATDPIYRDEEAAHRAGYRAIPAPPTFAYSITMEAGQSFNVLDDMKVPLARAVHGAQAFAYKTPIFAGDTITGRQRVASIFEKKGGALLFIETEIALSNQRGEEVCDLRSTIIVRRS